MVLWGHGERNGRGKKQSVADKIIKGKEGNEIWEKVKGIETRLFSGKKIAAFSAFYVAKKVIGKVYNGSFPPS